MVSEGLPWVEPFVLRNVDIHLFIRNTVEAYRSFFFLLLCFTLCHSNALKAFQDMMQFDEILRKQLTNRIRCRRRSREQSLIPADLQVMLGTCAASQNGRRRWEGVVKSNASSRPSRFLKHYADHSAKQSSCFFPIPAHGSMQLFSTFPLNLQHFVRQLFLCEAVVKTPFYLYQRANDLWSYHELSFALIPVIKSNPGSNIRHLSSCGEETRKLFKYSCEKKRCSAFCDEKLMSYISPLVYEKGNISSYIVTSFLLCYLDYHLFPLSPPGLSACPASSLYKT